MKTVYAFNTKRVIDDEVIFDYYLYETYEAALDALEAVYDTTFLDYENDYDEWQKTDDSFYFWNTRDTPDYFEGWIIDVEVR